MLHDDRSTQRLQLAIGAAAAEVVVQMVVLVARGALGVAPLRIAFLAAKLPFCWHALRRRPGAFLAVWLWEFAGFAAAFSVHGWALAPRLATAAGAAVVMVLLGRAFSAFPTVEFKPR